MSRRVRATVVVGKQYLLLIKRYNLCKVLACSTAFFQPSLSCATFFQLCTFILISSIMSSSQRVLGLPIGVLDMGFQLLIFCTLLSSAMRSTWPNQWKSNMYYILWVCVYSLSYSVCIAHAPYCHLWPVRLYNIFPRYLINGTIFGGGKKSLNTIYIYFPMSPHVLSDFVVPPQPCFSQVYQRA